jgi:hypothetical protein
MSLKTIKVIFLLTAIFNFVLGAGLGLFFREINEWSDLQLPNHPAYMQLPSLFVFVFGIGMLFVVYDPLGNRSIMLLGVLMKTSYAVVILGNSFFHTMPLLHVAVAGCDLVHALLFLAAYLATRPQVLKRASAEAGCAVGY